MERFCAAGFTVADGTELSYAGSKGTHLQSVVDRNQDVTPGPGDIQSRPAVSYVRPLCCD